MIKPHVTLLWLVAMMAFARMTAGHETEPAATPSSGVAPLAEAQPPLTREQVVAPVHAARAVYKQQLLAAIDAFARQVAAQADADTDAQDAIAALQVRIAQDAAAVREDRYVSAFAGEEADFAIKSLADARQIYVAALDVAGNTYYAALQAALKQDDYGYIGDMMMQELDHSIDGNLMLQLMDYYWHRGDLDTPPRSFERNIRLAYRYVELEPRSPRIYCNGAWLLWSRWVSWKQSPDTRPLGEGDDRAALRFLLQGREANMDDAAYHFEAAMTLWGLAKYHDPTYFDFLIDSLKLADARADDNPMRAKSRLTLGHVYRETKQLDKARKAYRGVLEVDPAHEIAARLLEELGPDEH